MSKKQADGVKIQDIDTSGIVLPPSKEKQNQNDQGDLELDTLYKLSLDAKAKMQQLSTDKKTPVCKNIKKQ